MVLQLSLSVSHCLNHKTKMGIPVPRINCEPRVLMYTACSVPDKSYLLNETLPNYVLTRSVTANTKSRSCLCLMGKCCLSLIFLKLERGGLQLKCNIRLTIVCTRLLIGL